MKPLLKQKQKRNKSLALPHIKSLVGTRKSSGDKTTNVLALSDDSFIKKFMVKFPDLIGKI